MKVLAPTSTIALLALAGLAPFALPSDHREAPLIQEDPAADLADVYAFLNPRDPSKLVLALTVNPFSVPAEGVTFNFSPNVRYRFHIDNDGDAISDAEINLNFSRITSTQSVRAEFPDGSVLTGLVTLPTEEPVPNDPIINQGPGGIRVFAGPRDDPFFFDVVGFFRFLAGTGTFTGSDGFAGFNTSAVVVEIPIAMVSNGNQALQVWSTTERRKITLRRSDTGHLQQDIGPWLQVERQGNPAINTALIPAAKKDFFNIGLPKNDATDFAADIVASLEALGTNAKNIAILAAIAVPDTIKLDPVMPIEYPNGRRPEDDVLDTLLFFIFNQTPVSDGVDANDVPFPTTFPYLAAPHQPL